jgi:ABC-type dipeptide/oligopeptide/nickel transport system permease subunit
LGVGEWIDSGQDYGGAQQRLSRRGYRIVLAVLGFNLLGDGLRDVLDPQTRSA